MTINFFHLLKIINIFINKYEYNKKLNYILPKKINQKHNSENMQFCTGGRTGLVIYPNGNVGICERIVNFNLLDLNIKDHSLLDIWYSNSLRNIIEPSREKFKNTLCYRCKEFSECVLKKGLCYARAKMDGNEYFSPDPLCYLTTVKKRFI